jgi:hypothetical protein
VNVDITPSPQPEEREALIAALGRLLADPERRLPQQYRSAWRLAGLREATEVALPAAPDRRGNRQP